MLLLKAIVSTPPMCECVTPHRHSWKGWIPLPPSSPIHSDAPWHDLTHVITEELSRSPAFPKPRIRKLLSLPEGNANITEVQMVCHHGTHVDAPSHFMLDGPTMDQIPIERLHGPGVIWRIEKGPLAQIDVSDLEAARPQLRAGDILIIDTNWSRFINTPKYEEHASLTVEAAQWLVQQQVKLVGVDFSTPDLASHVRPPDFTWPVHQILLSNGVLVAEHLTNLAPLADRRVEVMFMAVPIAGSDGAPARVLARDAS